MKNKRIFIILYFVLVAVIVLTSSTLAKYSSVTSSRVDFNIGSKLYFNYQRSNLYRNDKLIIGQETEYEENGEIKRRIETMNVAPGDGLKYHFFVSNFNLDTKEENGIEGTFIPISNAIISLPMRGQTYDIDCLITYRKVPLDENGNDLPENTEMFVSLTDQIKLPKASDEKIKYEFQVTVVLDDQVSDTTSDDYFGATLNMYLFVNGASLAD